MKKTVSNQTTLLILSVLSVLSGVLCVFANDILLFLPIAFLSALYYFDNSERRFLSIAISSVLFILNAVGFALGVTYSLFAPAAAILAFIMTYCFVNKQSKSDAAFLMTIICGIFTFVSGLLFAMILQNDYSFDSAISFYNNIISNLREVFVKLSFEAYAGAGMEVTEEFLLQLFNAQINMIVSYLFITAFFMVGISFKLFGFIIKRTVDNKDEILSWKFKTSNVFAYFYVILVFLAMFLNSPTDLFSVVVFNLYSVFLVVYAYIGFNVVKDILKTRMRPVMAGFVIIFALLVLPSFAVQILAVSGVFHTIRTNRALIDNN